MSHVGELGVAGYAWPARHGCCKASSSSTRRGGQRLGDAWRPYGGPSLVVTGGTRL
jgi:hypothetical protein